MPMLIESQNILHTLQIVTKNPCPHLAVDGRDELERSQTMGIV
jgi:hypothetical protein